MRSCLHLIVCRIERQLHTTFFLSSQPFEMVVYRRRTLKFSRKYIVLDILQSFICLQSFCRISLVPIPYGTTEDWHSLPQTYNSKHVFKSLYHKAFLKHHHNVNKDLPSLQFPAWVCGISRLPPKTLYETKRTIRLYLYEKHSKKGRVETFSVCPLIHLYTTIVNNNNLAIRQQYPFIQADFTTFEYY